VDVRGRSANRGEIVLVVVGLCLRACEDEFVSVWTIRGADANRGNGWSVPKHELRMCVDLGGLVVRGGYMHGLRAANAIVGL